MFSSDFVLVFVMRYVESEGRFLCSGRVFSILLQVHYGVIETLLILNFASDLVSIVIVHVLRTALHLRFHEVLCGSQTIVPILQTGYDILHCCVLDITTKCAGDVERLVFLVESTLQQVGVDAVNNLIFELANVCDSKCLHHFIVRYHGLLGGHVSNGNHLQLLLLRGLKS